MQRSFSPEQLQNGIRRLGKERLVEECQSRLNKPPDGTAWNKMPIGTLAQELVDGLSTDVAEPLAAEGMQKQRTPSVGGPSWQCGGSVKLSAGTVGERMKKLHKSLPSDWTDIKVVLESAELFGGIALVSYTDWVPQPSSDGLVWVPARKTALILLDYDSQVFTVSANSDTDALIVGAAWSKTMGGGAILIELTIVPSFDLPPLSSMTVKVLEAVYGRIGGVGQVINVDAVSTRRGDPNTPVKWQNAKGADNHVLLDEDVRAYLTRGDDLVGIAFQFDWEYKSGSEPKHFITHITLNASEGPLNLRLTRGGHKLDLASSLYVQLRRALLAATDQNGKKRLNQVTTHEILNK